MTDSIKTKLEALLNSLGQTHEGDVEYFLSRLSEVGLVVGEAQEEVPLMWCVKDDDGKLYTPCKVREAAWQTIEMFVGEREILIEEGWSIVRVKVQELPASPEGDEV